MIRLKLVILGALLIIGQASLSIGAVQYEPFMRYGLGTVADCSLAADKSVFATAGGIGVVVWNAKTYERIRIMSAPGHLANAVAVSPSGKLIASGEGYFSGRILIWDAKSGQVVHDINVQTYTITTLAFSPDGTKLLAGARDNTLVMYDVETGGIVKEYTPFTPVESRESNPESVSFSSDGMRFVATSWGAQQMCIYDIDQSDPILTYDAPDGVGYAEFSPDGAQVAGTLAAGDDRCFI